MNDPHQLAYESDEIKITTQTDGIKDNKSLNGASSKRTYWGLFGWKFPKSEFVFFAQIILIYIVVSVSLYNLTWPDVNKNNDKLWITLLASSIGYILPNPSFKGI